MEHSLRKFLFEVARGWLAFARECCTPGQRKPRWMRQGLDFIQLVTKPGITWHLTNCEFETLREEVDGLVDHLSEVVMPQKYRNRCSSPLAELARVHPI